MKNTKVGLSVLICGAALLLGSVEATILVLPAPVRTHQSPQPRIPGCPTLAQGDRLPSAVVPEYSVYSRSEQTVRHLHDALVEVMAESGYQRGWRQVVDGRGVETWYHRGLDQTVMSVRWPTEAGYVQSTFRQPGRLRAGEVRGSGTPGDVAPTATLEDTLQAFNVVVTPEDADQAASVGEVSQQRFQGLATFLQQRGFRLNWIREDLHPAKGPTYVAWYHRDLNMTVVCMAH